MLTPSDKERVTAAIGAAETRGWCQIEIATVRRSEEYAGPRAPTAGLLALVLALALVHAMRLGAYAAAIATVVVAAVVYAVLGAAPLVRLLLPAREAEVAVRRQAHALFAEQLLARAGAPRSVMVFVSLLEQRVVVLVERRVGEAPGPWASIATDLERALRAGRFADGLLAALDRIGAALAPPARPSA